LREASRSSPQIEVVQNIEDVRRSLRFVAEHGAAAEKTALATARIFANTQDDETRRLCINGLYRINNETAKKELLHLYQDGQIETVWRTLSAEYLRMAVREEQRIAPADAKIISAVVGQ
jgi:HEAT repeat protein